MVAEVISGKNFTITNTDCLKVHFMTNNTNTDKS